MKKSIILKTLLILGSLIVSIFLGFGYLFSQNDNKLISDIRKYNLDSAMKALDNRQAERLAINQEQMKEIVTTIAKNASSYLMDYDSNGLKKSLEFDMKKDAVKAIQIWDNEVGEIFVLAIKDNSKVVFNDSLPKEYEKFTKFKHSINHTNAYDAVEELGMITFYYDESSIIEKIKKLKENTSIEIAKFNATVDKELEESNTIKLLMSIGALIAILFVMSILLMSFVNKPLKNLQYGLDSFFLFLQGKQDFTKRIEISSDDEFGQMATSLNENIAVSARLHEELNSLYTEVEKKVQIRTQELAEINQEVQDSIEYASTIQRSFLKDTALIEQTLGDSFVVWQPRDKVGGDLYIYEESDEGIIFGVVDCTGHSVPGGFMTMLAGSMIKKLSNDHFSDPAKLLGELNIAIKTQLNQDVENSLSDDGLDMGLCYINKNGTLLKFAGAKMDLLYFKDKEQHIVKSNKQSIGYNRSKSDYEYTNHEIHVDSSESFYLYSDGITDQTGGDKNFPYGNKKFKTFLSEIQEKPMAEQEQLIVGNLLEYQKENTRRDDITIIGFKIKKGEEV
ncbi:MAG: serine phosphatase RsbU (regulator of sigma subunit) [Sulfurimonas sp.]|jgi:serine phosphatase RsbU (regulator of sigma subunit)|uniref:SpoIIE family protein phosphatase n=1 Tax=Sulfurimonas sp. TaxID=2022749 RepID=UPI0039E3A719